MLYLEHGVITHWALVSCASENVNLVKAVSKWLLRMIAGQLRLMNKAEPLVPGITPIAYGPMRSYREVPQQGW